jgi:cell division transport system ATP-binding protein
MESLLQLSKAHIRQNNHPVLSDVSFSIQKGEFVYLIGRNGSGKSSLLKTLYADLPIQEGVGVVAGYDLRKLKRKDIPKLRRKLGIVFQDFQLFQDRTITDNLHFVLKATGWTDSSKIKQRIAEVLMRVGLGSVNTKYPYQLSGGEQQRAVIARALLNDPMLLLADEPTGNLDPDVAAGIFKLFVEINRGGTAVIMATHNYRFIQDAPQRVLKCEEGKLKDSLHEPGILPAPN